MVKTQVTDERLSGFTFLVDDVTPAETSLLSVKTKQAVESLLELPIEAASDYSDNCVEGVVNHPLVMAVVLAYAEHRPLTISPDAVWLTLLQGLGDHLDFTGDRYDQLLTQNLATRHFALLDTSDCHRGSPESPWDEIVEQATAQASDWVRPEFIELFQLEFSTTTPASRIASRLAFLSTVKKFVSFIEGWICGIPEITLQGELNDWKRIRRSIELMRPFDLDWWLDPLGEILDEFVAAASGKPDIKFWKRICNSLESSSCHEGAVSGWIAKLFPYTYRRYRPNKQNPLLTSDEILWFDEFPKGVREIPLKLQNGDTMRLFGGLMGISQCEETWRLTPKLGWCVARQDSYDGLLDRIAAANYCEAPLAVGKGSASGKQQSKFYHRFESLRVFDDQGQEWARIRPLEAIQNAKRLETDNGLGIVGELADGRLIGMRMFLLDEAPYVLHSYFLMEARDSESADLLAGDFEGLLNWLVPAKAYAAGQVPEPKVIARLEVMGLQSNHEDEKSQAILKALDSRT